MCPIRTVGVCFLCVCLLAGGVLGKPGHSRRRRSFAAADDALSVYSPASTAPADACVLQSAAGEVAVLAADAADAEVVMVAQRSVGGDWKARFGAEPQVAALKTVQDPVDYTGAVPTLVWGATLHSDAPAPSQSAMAYSPALEALLSAAGAPLQSALHVSALRSQWEMFRIVAVPARAGLWPANAFPGAQCVVFVVGSDRRGTAYGLYELAQRTGISPWSWWADVTPQPVPAGAGLAVAGGDQQGPPSVKYRGIFINDEDWGFHPWSALYEGDSTGAGPKTYARVFELLLRLKLNMIWPAMHSISAAFNAHNESKYVADQYAIVMSSSHCEPMLRDNGWEWYRYTTTKWDWATNNATVTSYWRERAQTNGPFDNIWELGMRGIDDNTMPCAGCSTQQKITMLENIQAAQRQLLVDYVRPDITSIPQQIVLYKEVLDFYRAGLKVPDDVIIAYVDDDHAHLRQLKPVGSSTAGGCGVYFHHSYLGDPTSYLWVSSTAPGETYAELAKTAAFGCSKMWVTNVGDIKPAELTMSHFAALGWNLSAPLVGQQRAWLVQFARDSFALSAAVAAEEAVAQQIADVWNDFYTLAQRRRPEHMGFQTQCCPAGKQTDPVDFAYWLMGDQLNSRLDACAALRSHVLALAAGDWLVRDRPSLQAAFFQLVVYPLVGAADLNIKVLSAYASRVFAPHAISYANVSAAAAEAAFDEIRNLTQTYTSALPSGVADKWTKMIVYNPFDTQTQPATGSLFDAPLSAFAPPVGPTTPAFVAWPENCTAPLPAAACHLPVFASHAPAVRHFVDLYYVTDSMTATVNISCADMSASPCWLRVAARERHSSGLWERFWLALDPALLPPSPATPTVYAATASFATSELAITEVPVLALQSGLAAGARAADNGVLSLEAEDADEMIARDGAAFVALDGVGWNGHALQLQPRTYDPIPLDRAPQHAPELTFEFETITPGPSAVHVFVHAAPTFAEHNGRAVRIAVSVDALPLQWANFTTGDETSGTYIWGQHVLRHRMTCDVAPAFTLSAGTHVLHLFAAEPSIVLDALELHLDAALTMWPASSEPESTARSGRSHARRRHHASRV